MDSNHDEDGRSHALCGTARALVVLLGLRLIAWSVLASVGLYCFLNDAEELSVSVWRLAGTPAAPPATADAYATGELIVLLGGPLFFHIIVLACLLLRLRWVSNGLITLWAVLAINAAPPGVDGILYIPVWLLLVAPSTQASLARSPEEDCSGGRPASWTDRLKSIGYAILSGLIPGLGQLLQKRWTRAAALFIPWALAAGLHLEPVWILVALYAMSDAGWVALERLQATKLESDS